MQSDLEMVLKKALFQYKHWMLVLQRWEPILSDTFPSTIPFWIWIQGFPWHYWTDEILETIGKKLGHVVNTDSDEGNVQVEEIRIDFEYKNLHKHCLLCMRLDQEEQDCRSGNKDSSASDKSR